MGSSDFRLCRRHVDPIAHGFGALASLAEDYRNEPAPKGEIAVVVGPPEARPPAMEDNLVSL